MMDAKYLAEIKAREQAATKGPWKVGDGDEKSWFCGPEAVVSKLRVVTDRAVYGNGSEFDSQTYRDIAFVAAARTDIPNLIAEVERLQKCRDGCKIDCLLDEYNKVVEERDTLKNALEMACEQFKDEGNCILEGCSGANCIQDCALCMHDYFTRQAQEQEASDET